jgi:hypothetical protein
VTLLGHNAAIELQRGTFAQLSRRRCISQMTESAIVEALA